MNELLKSLHVDQQQIVEKFVSHEKQKCSDNNIVFILEDAMRVQYFGRMCNGFFEAEMNIDGKIQPCMATAIGKPLDQWLPTFVHETSHMDQFLENSPLWMSTEEYGVCDKWLEGEMVTTDLINQTIDKIILLEADCEKRSIEKIQKYNLPINIKDYCKKGNSYLLFHHWMLANKLWYNKAPYEIEKIIKEMDSELHSLNFYLQKPNQKIMELFELCR